jgi:mRNA interferase MazF
MIKKFLEWIRLKQKIHNESSGPLYYNEGEIWWCAIGENVGIEINGKGRLFSRPVFVYKKLSREGFLGIPFSTQEKKGTWYIEVFFKGEKNIANLSQVRIISSCRMYEKMGTLDKNDIKKIKNGFLRLYS